MACAGRSPNGSGPTCGSARAVARCGRATAPNALSQYIRRILVEQLGQPGEWDWAVFPGTKYMRATMEHFHQIPMP